MHTKVKSWCYWPRMAALPSIMNRRTFLKVISGGGSATLVGMPAFISLNAAIPESGIAVGLRKQLLVDDEVIAEKTNLTRRPGLVTKGGIVLKPTLETDHGASFGFYHTALYNPNEMKFQMW